MDKILRIQLNEKECENFDYKCTFPWYEKWKECELLSDGVLVGEAGIVNSILKYL